MRLWPAIVALVGFVGWCYTVSATLKSHGDALTETRADVKSLIRHTDWGQHGESGPAPPVREGK